MSAVPLPLVWDRDIHDAPFSAYAVHVSFVVTVIPMLPPLLVYSKRLLDIVRYFPFWLTDILSVLSPMVTDTLPVRSLLDVFSVTLTSNVEFPEAVVGLTLIHEALLVAFQVPSVSIATD